MPSKVKIGIIDNGIDETLLQNPIEHNVLVDEQGVYQNICLDINKQNFHHGTNCAMIIEKYCPNCALSSVKILDESGKGFIDRFGPALEWCYQNEIRLVNLSLGTTHFADKEIVRLITNKYANHGMVIVAASANNGYTTYPASFSNVIGVTAGDIFSYNDFARRVKGIEFEACSEHNLSRNGVGFRTEKSNSYAAPYVTAYIGNIFYNEGYLGKREIVNRLLKKFNCKEKDYGILSLPDWITEAFLVDLKNNSQAEYYFTTVEGGNEENKEQIDTIIIKSFNEMNPISCINKKVVYLGNEAIKDAGINDFIWNKHDRINQMIHLQKETGNLEIPVILCVMQNDFDEFQWLCELRRHFSIDGYQIYTISFKEESVLYGLEYIPDDFIEQDSCEDFYNFIYNQTYFNQSDAMLIGINRDNFEKIRRKIRVMDMLMVLEREETSMSVEIWCDNKFKTIVTYEITDSNFIKDSYLNIVRFLTEYKND